MKIIVVTEWSSLPLSDRDEICGKDAGRRRRRGQLCQLLWRLVADVVVDPERASAVAHKCVVCIHSSDLVERGCPDGCCAVPAPPEAPLVLLAQGARVQHRPVEEGRDVCLRLGGGGGFFAREAVFAGLERNGVLPGKG